MESSTNGSSSPALRVLHVVRSLEVGGLERVACELTTARGVDKTDVACLTARGEFVDTLQNAGGRVHVLCDPPAGKRKLVSRLAGVLREVRPDVVHCHNLFAYLVGSAAALLRGAIPIVLTKHGIVVPRSAAKSAAYRLLLRRTQVVCVSSEIRGVMTRWAPFLTQSITCIPNGVSIGDALGAGEKASLRQALGWGADEWVFIVVCRIVKGKGLGDLVTAFESVKAELPRSRLVIVGDGAYLEELRGLAEASPARQAIDFLGKRMDVGRLLSAADAFVLPSENEGLPMALLEAMAAELPAIVTAVGEMPEVVQQETTGLIVQPRSPQSLACAMQQIAGDRSRACAMGRAGRQRAAAEFSLARAVERYEDIYRRALGGRSA